MEAMRKTKYRSVVLHYQHFLTCSFSLCSSATLAIDHIFGRFIYLWPTLFEFFGTAWPDQASNDVAVVFRNEMICGVETNIYISISIN